MALVPTYRKWKVDKEGKYLLDKDGNKIPDPRVGTRMADKDRTPQEQQHFDDQIRAYDMRKKWEAAHQLAALGEAKATLLKG